MSAAIATPWGQPDNSKEIAPGIIRYDTPSHGGYYVSPERVLTMSKPLREFHPWAGPNWYEEDCDWAIVMENDDAVTTLNELIDEARTLVAQAEGRAA